MHFYYILFCFHFSIWSIRIRVSSRYRYTIRWQIIYEIIFWIYDQRNFEWEGNQHSIWYFFLKSSLGASWKFNALQKANKHCLALVESKFKTKINQMSKLKIKINFQIALHCIAMHRTEAGYRRFSYGFRKMNFRLIVTLEFKLHFEFHTAPMCLLFHLNFFMNSKRT